VSELKQVEVHMLDVSSSQNNLAEAEEVKAYFDDAPQQSLDLK
jgi:hypothetical protein